MIEQHPALVRVELNFNRLGPEGAASIAAALAANAALTTLHVPSASSNISFCTKINLFKIVLIYAA